MYPRIIQLILEVVIMSYRPSSETPFFTASMSTSDLGPCVVCGKESATRCAGCAKNGIKWMHFCSREHQKLVSVKSGSHISTRLIRSYARQIYFVHKRVCGSNPFRWPGFSETEIQQFLDVSDVAIDFQHGPPASVLAGLKPQFTRLLPPAAREDKTAQKGVLRVSSSSLAFSSEIFERPP